MSKTYTGRDDVEGGGNDGDDGVHDPSKRPTEPLDETPEERKARLGKDETAEQEQENAQQARADKRRAAKEGADE